MSFSKLHVYSYERTLASPTFYFSDIKFLSETHTNQPLTARRRRTTIGLHNRFGTRVTIINVVAALTSIITGYHQRIMKLEEEKYDHEMEVARRQMEV